MPTIPHLGTSRCVRNSSTAARFRAIFAALLSVAAIIVAILPMKYANSVAPTNVAVRGHFHSRG